MGSKKTSGAIWGRFWRVLGRFWEGFGRILDDFLADFGTILGKFIYAGELVLNLNSNLHAQVSLILFVFPRKKHCYC